MPQISIDEITTEIKNNIQIAKQAGVEVLIVDADTSKGFNFPYLLIYPQSNMENSLTIDCLNDYEFSMPANSVDNLSAIEEMFNLFGNNRIRSSLPTNIDRNSEENIDYSRVRIAQRLESALSNIKVLLTKAGVEAPIIMPLIPGYIDDTLRHTASEISKDFVGDVDLQVVRMVESAIEIIKERTGIDIDSQIVGFGHSKSATFANNFTALHPDKVKALIIGGTEYTTLPIEEIRLRVVDNTRYSEQFEVIDGISYKNVTLEELEKIIMDYNSSKENLQREININSDGTYSLPMNYPLGIADIEHYIDFSIFPNGKEGYIESLKQIPRMIFVGEREEEIEGAMAYNSGYTFSGNSYRYAQELDFLEPDKKAYQLYEVEKSSMHNRVLEYKEATLILFGRGTNERLRNFMDLATKLGLNIQSKIYKGVAHKGIFDARCLAEDIKRSFISISDDKRIPRLNGEGGVLRISPIFQLLRRCKVCLNSKEYNRICDELPVSPEFPKRNDYATDEEYESAKKQYDIDRKKYYIKLDFMLEKIDEYIHKTRRITHETNMDKIYDGLTPDELRKILIRDNLLKKYLKKVKDYLKTRIGIKKLEN